MCKNGKKMAKIWEILPNMAKRGNRLEIEK
jgi:hypothetical protein